MASYVVPKKNTEYIFYIGLVAQANTKVLQSSPTIAAGDFKVSIDGGAFANLTTLPVVTPASGKAVKITLSAAEMNGDNIVVLCSDAAGAEWCDQLINIQTATRQVDDLTYPTTSGRSIDVATTGEVGLDFDNVKQATGATTLNNVTVPTVTNLTNSVALSAAAVDAILDEVVEGTYTLRQMMRITFAIVAGKSSGGGSSTVAFRDVADTKNRVSATVDSSGNRTAVTIDEA